MQIYKKNFNGNPSNNTQEDPKNIIKLEHQYDIVLIATALSIIAIIVLISIIIFSFFVRRWLKRGSKNHLENTDVCIYEEIDESKVNTNNINYSQPQDFAYNEVFDGIPFNSFYSEIKHNSLK